jgi:DNA-binding response OmpR family regulator
MSRPVLAIVDDYPPFLDYLSTFLRMRSYDTRAYVSGREIIAAFRAGQLPDLVLLDVMMPGIDGLETLQALKEVAPAVPVIMLSARNETATVVDAVRLGALDYLIKPDDPEGLAEIALDVAIKDALARLERVKELTARSEAGSQTGRAARLDPDVAQAFPTDAMVNDALRRVIREKGQQIE